MSNVETRPKLSVVIPSYNGRALLERCLASVKTHRPPDLAIEVIVADDASTDDTARWLGPTHPDVWLVRSRVNGGFARAANMGIAAARGEIIQLLNNDTEVTAGWAEAGLAPFRNPYVGSVAPLVLVMSDPGRVDSAGDRYGWAGWPCKRGHGDPASRWADREPETVFGASASSAFYRAEALRRAGAFDPSFGSYYEDIDLAFRLRWAGFGCVFAPKSRILHAISASYDHGSDALQRRMARNAELVFWSNLPTARLAASFWPHAAFTVMQGLVRAARGRFGPFWAGKRDAWAMRGELFARRRTRIDLAATSPTRRPHFPVGGGGLSDVRRHLARPRS
jgi:GT2 family glycosyltransferase